MARYMDDIVDKLITMIFRFFFFWTFSDMGYRIMSEFPNPKLDLLNSVILVVRPHCLHQCVLVAFTDGLHSLRNSGSAITI